VNQVTESYYKVVDELMRQFYDPGLSDEDRVYVIYLLGELRAHKAISVLIKYIDLKATRNDPKTRIARWGPYPAQEALVKIGRHAVWMILDKLPDEKNELRRRLMSHVIIDVHGRDIGAILIRKRLDLEKDPARWANLEAAQQYFEQPK